MSVTLKVMTLNCWGLPFPVICKNRQERISAIGDFLQEEDFDVVVLEEIWVKSDFQQLKAKVEKNLPFSHYFYSGTIGSGICVFSKHFIAETQYHRYHLNGHAHKVFHGDWFGGKGVGLCKIHREGLDINLYCTHFHAEYNADQDEYEAHRLAQAFEISQFIRSTSLDCDMVILAGDLNFTPAALGYKVVTQHAQLHDVWVQRENKGEDDDCGTCDVPGNTYASAQVLARCPNGERIDHIMYRVNSNFEASVPECRIGLGKIPELNLSYSDHEAVIASICVSKIAETSGTVRRPMMSKEARETLQESLLVLDKGVSQCLSDEKFFQLIVFVLSLILYVTNSYLDVADYENSILVIFTLSSAKLLMAIAIGFSVWIALIVKRDEFHGLIACKEDIMKLLGM